MKTPFEIGGKKDTAHMLAVMTRDSQYRYNAMGKERGDAEASATLRPYLAREYAALDAAGAGLLATGGVGRHPVGAGAEVLALGAEHDRPAPRIGVQTVAPLDALA
mgnify:CR=1 FL=1